VYGDFLRHVGRHEAGVHLTTAVTMYREMETRFWLEQAQVKMNELA
jgi:hypothetical protein